MTNAEIDALVAERVMGMRPSEGHIAWGWGIFSPPRFSTDIAEAWQVVQHLTSQEYEVRLITRPKGALQVVELHRYPVKIAEVYAAPMPMAICLAALRTVGVTVEA